MSHECPCVGKVTDIFVHYLDNGVSVIKSCELRLPSIVVSMDCFNGFDWQASKDV